MEQETLPRDIYIFSKVGGLDRTRIGEIIADHSAKKGLLKDSSFNIYIGEHKESFRDREHNLLYARLRVHTPFGGFFCTAEGWGVENLLRNALEKIERQMERKLDNDLNLAAL